MDTPELISGSRLVSVSVIIPCYNCEQWVTRAVNSVLSQLYQVDELLLINNNSTDSTLNVLYELEKSSPETIKVYTQQRAGASAARNLGLEKAKGEWIQFLDADDELLPSKILKQVELIHQTDPDLIVSDYKKVHLRRLENTKFKILTQDIVAEDDHWLGLINTRLGITSSNLWKKSLLQRVKGWNEAFTSSQDYELLFRILQLKPKIVLTHQVDTIIHRQYESVSRSFNLDRIYEIYLNRYNLRCTIYNYLVDNGILSTNHKRALILFLYYHLLLISELNMTYFKEQIKNYDFRGIGLLSKLNTLLNYTRHSTKRRYADANIILKALEIQYHFLKNIKLLSY